MTEPKKPGARRRKPAPTTNGATPTPTAELAVEAANRVPEEHKVEVAKAVVEGVPEDSRGDVALAAVEAVPPTDASRKDIATAAMAALPEQEKVDAAAAVMGALTADQQKQLVDRLPSDSKDRRWVYVVGFVVAGVVAIGLSALAWGAQSGDNSIAASLIVLATGFTSAILGGLLGAYVQK